MPWVFLISVALGFSVVFESKTLEIPLLRLGQVLAKHVNEIFRLDREGKCGALTES